ncbi:MAG: CHAT domain-containing protein [Stackebrandtia sp.]
MVQPPDDPETADVLAQVRALKDAIREAELTGSVNPDDRARCRKLERQLRERSWQTDGPGHSVADVQPHQINDALADSDQTLVSFFNHQGQLHALTLAGGTTLHYALGPMAAVAEHTRRLLADLNAFTGRRLPSRLTATIQSSIRHQTEQLDKTLFSEFACHLGDRDLVVVPTQVLSSLPWGLLPTLRGRAVVVAPSASVWHAARDRPADGPGPALLASGPDLTHAETELDTIAEHHYGSVLLRGADATPAAILSALDGASVAHLAAHGYHEPDNVLFSRLDFAEGPLMAYDIARLRTPPAHVTLSACDVGRAKVAVGDETLGFTAALLYAGTRTVVSSVAKVEHEAAADVMTAYHAELVAGKTPAHALAAASSRQLFSPFVCYGAG